MKALSLLQPWASLVVMGVKKIETRGWSTKYRGDILIHASTGKSGNIFAAQHPFKKYIKEFKQLPFGAIIGKVTVIKIIRTEELLLPDAEINKLTMEEKAFGDYTSGRFAWMLEDAEQFKKPIPARGMLNLWEYKLNYKK